ncbi:hypothetical protein GCM10010430_14390 [Kitasatospora cystarginea]|uniref:Uncharacterized protein n=1 Tax=Kitasatospora cystarginea TaxID=58350 RepID=A0ABN3DKJ2_9ACTN
MRLDDQAELDTSRVQDRRGMSDGKDGKVAVGGGAVGLIGRLLALFLGVDPSTLGLFGDDRMRRATGRVNPESRHHGSSAQRRQWFGTGYRTGDLAKCNTFG